MTVPARNKRLQGTLALFLLSLGVAACNTGQSGSAEARKDAAASYSSSLSVNGITFQGSRFGATEIRNGRLRTAIGGHAVSLEDSRLRVDGTDYGHVKPGDTVTVTDRGTVLVNGGPARRE